MLEVFTGGRLSERKAEFGLPREGGCEKQKTHKGPRKRTPDSRYKGWDDIRCTTSAGVCGTMRTELSTLPLFWSMHESRQRLTGKPILLKLTG